MLLLDTVEAHKISCHHSPLVVYRICQPLSTGYASLCRGHRYQEACFHRRRGYVAPSWRSFSLSWHGRCVRVKYLTSWRLGSGGGRTPSSFSHVSHRDPTHHQGRSFPPVNCLWKHLVRDTHSHVLLVS